MSEPVLTRVAGAIAEARSMGEASLYELVRVGERELLGEVIRVAGDDATIQVFEETAGLSLGEPVRRTGSTLTVELGPGLLGATLDGVGRPLEVLGAEGPFLAPGGDAATLDRDAVWTFEPAVEVGAEVSEGDVLGTVEERPGLTHRILLPPDLSGAIDGIEGGSYRVDEPFGRLGDGSELTLLQRWPVRVPRPVSDRLSADRPFVTGQRVFDFLFPVAEGGSVAVPGGFGTGKTVIEQTLAKYAAAEVVVYVGCGERGNEMAEMLGEFPELSDPRTGRPVLDRTVLVVNTSNMPVVAREASVHLGFTVAEYYRDMGYRVALMADSLSRWAEALREVASRLQEMPGEEGYPTYLANRLAKLFERSGRVRTIGSEPRTGALTFVCAVSPPGGDFSEPVTQASLRVAGGLWALDADLAHQRHYPAVDWESSYSLYAEGTGRWFAQRSADDWPRLREEAFELLQREAELREISGLVGPEALEDADRLLLEVARLLREQVLAQDAFDPKDAYTAPAVTHALVSLLWRFRREAEARLEAGATLSTIEFARIRSPLKEVRRADEEELDTAVREAHEAIERALPAVEEAS